VSTTTVSVTVVLGLLYRSKHTTEKTRGWVANAVLIVGEKNKTVVR
jgi:hypothetical protein